jgi:hypothetical protein
MTFQCTLTPADLRESMALPRARHDVVWTQMVAYAVLLAVAIPLAAGTMGEEPPAALAAAAAGPARDLWVTLAPSLVGVTLVVGGALAGRRRLRRTLAVRAQPDRTTLRPSIPVPLPVVVAFTWMILPNVPALAIHWHPTPRRVLWAAVAPWFAYLMFTSAVVLAHARRSAALMWDVQGSVRRASTLQFSDDGIIVADRHVEQRFRWPYVVRYRETDNLLLLDTEDTLTLILPKRVIPDPATEGGLRTLIQRHVAAGAFLPRDPEWPAPVLPLPPEPE